MGNSQHKVSILRDPTAYVQKLQSTKSGCVVYSCSLERWNRGTAYVCGCGDRADYHTPREDFRSRGFLLRPDTTEGRYFKLHVVNSTKVLVEEFSCNKVTTVYIPAYHTSPRYTVPLPLLTDIRMCIINYVQQYVARDGIYIIGCRGDLVVVQVLNKKERYVPEFYFIDLSTGRCMGKLVSPGCELAWYECLISFDKARVILRAEPISCSISAVDSQPILNPMRDYKIGKLIITLMKTFPDGNHGCLLTFDHRHEHRYLFRAKGKVVERYDLVKKTVAEQSSDLRLPAPICQLRGSPGGLYLALRCAHPTYSMEYRVNVVVIVAANSLEVLMQIDVRGSYWPSSEVINLQVFPVFSSCESAIAVMKHRTASRRVQIYKLPILSLNLQHLCRQTIRRSIFIHDIYKLRLPPKLIRYLCYEVIL